MVHPFVDDCHDADGAICQSLPVDETPFILANEPAHPEFCWNSPPGKFSRCDAFEAGEHHTFGPLFVLSNKIAHIFTDILIRAGVADIGGNKFAQRASDAQI
jgi:hypothetical protein